MSGSKKKVERKEEAKAVALNPEAVSQLVATHNALAGKREALQGVRDGVQKALDEVNGNLTITRRQLEAVQKAGADVAKADVKDGKPAEEAPAQA